MIMRKSLGEHFIKKLFKKGTFESFKVIFDKTFIYLHLFKKTPRTAETWG